MNHHQTLICLHLNTELPASRMGSHTFLLWRTHAEEHATLFQFLKGTSRASSPSCVSSGLESFRLEEKNWPDLNLGTWCGCRGELSALRALKRYIFPSRNSSPESLTRPHSSVCELAQDPSRGCPVPTILALWGDKADYETDSSSQRVGGKTKNVSQEAADCVLVCCLRFCLVFTNIQGTPHTVCRLLHKMSFNVYIPCLLGCLRLQVKQKPDWTTLKQTGRCIIRHPMRRSCAHAQEVSSSFCGIVCYADSSCIPVAALFLHRRISELACVSQAGL